MRLYSFNKFLSTLLIFISLTFLFSCNTTKYVPENKYLLDRNHIRIEGDDLKENDFVPLLKQKPNKRILYNFRFHLGLYNLSKPGSEKWFSRNMKKIGEEPVIYDFMLTDRTKEQIGLYMTNLGYFNASIKDSVVFKKNDATVYYFINTGKPYRINKLTYQIEDTVINNLVITDSSNCLIKSGVALNVDLIQSERTRIEGMLRNQGYFNFTKDYVYFEVDTSFSNLTASLTIGIRKFQVKDEEGKKSYADHSKYKIGEIQVWVENRRTSDTLEYKIDEKMFDILSINDVEYIFRDKITIKPKLINNNIYLSENKIFNQKDVDETYKSLSSLKIFKFINIGFTEAGIDSTDSIKIVNCKIQFSTIGFQSYQTDGEITSITGIGVAGSLLYQHRNLFKGAEVFNIKLKGATEAIKSRNDLSFKKTMEYGAEASLLFPKFILPFRTDRFTREYNPKTNVSVSYSYMTRPQYTDRVLNFSFGYQWKGKRNNSYHVKPFDINFVDMLEIDSSYYETNISQSILKYNYKDHLVASSIVNYVYNNQKPKKNSSYQYAILNFESSGNFTRMASGILNFDKDSDNNYLILGIPFSQFLKFSIDLRHYLPVNQTDKIAFRFFTGIAYPYGNSKTIPFEKQFYAGGANSIRAWSVRSLGPGAYKDTSSTPPPFPDKASDIKIEGNIEYRFKLFWKLEGALFVDVGNIWSINNKDERDGAKFEINKFFSQVAVGSGIGTRFDFSFFILRIDLGIKLRDPAEKPGYRWMFKKDPASDITFNDLLNPVIGIDYPF